MDFSPQQYTKEDVEKAEKLFHQRCDFVIGVAKLEQLPSDDFPEIAFSGRSNVGKSSIINALFYQKKLAKTSNTPGRTQQLNYFLLDNRMYLVDLPGYGFAKAPENTVKNWQRLILAYLQGRVSLKRVFLLIDSRHGIKKVDADIMAMLDTAAVTYQIVLTKIDKIKAKELEQVIQKTEKQIKEHAAAYPYVLATSSEKGDGLSELRSEIYSIISQDL